MISGAAAGSASPHQRMHPGLRILLGIVLIVVGIGITAASHEAARGGGTYIIAYGPVGIGVVQIFQGLIGLFRRT